MRDDVERRRFELDVGTGVVFAAYREQDGLVAITHVEAPPDLRGQGHADRLMREVADEIRHRGVRLPPLCGYAAARMRRHRDDADLLPESA